MRFPRTGAFEVEAFETELDATGPVPPELDGSGPSSEALAPHRPRSGTYLSHENCVLPQTTGGGPQSFAGEVRSGQKTQSSTRIADRSAPPDRTAPAPKRHHEARGLSLREQSPAPQPPHPSGASARVVRPGRTCAYIRPAAYAPGEAGGRRPATRFLLNPAAQGPPEQQHRPL